MKIVGQSRFDIQQYLGKKDISVAVLSAAINSLMIKRKRSLMGNVRMYEYDKSNQQLIFVS